MTRHVWIALSVLSLTTATLAQTSGAPADPVSGTWTGLIGPSTAPDHAITMQLSFDGKTGVSGSAQGASGETATLRTGMFDPQTAALKLVFELKDGGPAPGQPATATFDGTVVVGTITGRLNLSNQPGHGTFMVTRRGVSPGSPAPPQGANDAALALQKGFEELSGWITKSAEMVPANRYTYQPVKTVRTYGQLIGHIADSHNYFCGRAAGKNVQWSDDIANGPTDKATLLSKLKQSIDACAAVYRNGQAPPLVANLGHSSLHYGNIVTYLRMLGLTPPSSSGG
jgi:hypothetical protein